MIDATGYSRLGLAYYDAYIGAPVRLIVVMLTAPGFGDAARVFAYRLELKFCLNGFYKG